MFRWICFFCTTVFSSSFAGVVDQYPTVAEAEFLRQLVERYTHYFPVRSDGQVIYEQSELIIKPQNIDNQQSGLYIFNNLGIFIRKSWKQLVENVFKCKNNSFQPPQ